MLNSTLNSWVLGFLMSGSLDGFGLSRGLITFSIHVQYRCHAEYFESKCCTLVASLLSWCRQSLTVIKGVNVWCLLLGFGCILQSITSWVSRE